jgi:hypothetical protein
MSDPSYKISQFCAVESISRGMLYKLWDQGKGPRYFFVGNSRRISHQARVEWRERLEAEAQQASNSGGV